MSYLSLVVSLETPRPSFSTRLAAFAREPFRIFFPLGVLAGMLGVALWPLHFWGLFEWYPGQVHARIMAFGLFGAFIIGFLGTAMPRMLSANPLKGAELISLVVLFTAMIAGFSAGSQKVGDISWLLLLATFGAMMGRRLGTRKDLPPPGFVLVAMAWLCVAAGALISVVANYRELEPFWGNLQKLLSYQGFVLLPIMGIGPFILPRFFGLKSTHDFPEMLKPTAGWASKAAFAFCAGAAIIASFIMEADGSYRFPYALRFVVVAAYGLLEIPWRSGPNAKNALGATIRAAYISLCLGFLAVAFLPEYRTGLLHVTLIGGFAVMTFAVATRVCFGHSGNIEKLKGRNRWILISVGLMLFAMATRISGDFVPHIMQSHYIYGAILWIVSAGIWAWYVLPKVLVFDKE